MTASLICLVYEGKLEATTDYIIIVDVTNSHSCLGSLPVFGGMRNFLMLPAAAISFSCIIFEFMNMLCNVCYAKWSSLTCWLPDQKEFRHENVT